MAGQTLYLSISDPAPDVWFTTGVAQVLGLDRRAVISFVNANDTQDPSTWNLATIFAIEFRDARTSEILPAFVKVAQTSPASLGRGYAVLDQTIAGKQIVIEDGMPTTTRADGLPVFPDHRQYAYAHGQTLYLFAAASEDIVAQLLAALP